MANEQIAGFPIMLDEFLNGISRAKTEMKAAFALLAKHEQITGPLQRSEWGRLFELFSSQPVNKTWREWVEQHPIADAIVEPAVPGVITGEIGAKTETVQSAKSKGGK